MTVCIHYARPASGQSEGEIFGLDVAVTNFLSAWFRHGKQDKFICRPTDMPSFEHFKDLAAASGVSAERCIGLDPRHPKHNLEAMDCLFRPDPLIGDFTWQRRQLSGRGYAACGLVHTMSGERIARAVGDLCVAPSGDTDALICPSAAIRDAVQNLWQIYAEYLNVHFGAKYQCPVQTPVIPLGIDTEKFARLSAADKRAQQRQTLGAKDGEIVILFLGRLSFATKAHPLALWMAAERAAKVSKHPLRIVMHGYFKPKDMEKHYHALAADIAKSVRIDFITNDDARFPDGLWAGADIFASLSDNVQESFGLTPVEAMAAGLPVIASDWDGYRATVRNGEEGFLIPTLTPSPKAGLAIAEAYYNEDNYGVALMGAAQSTAVDIERCTEAILLLAGDEARRKAFGAKGRARAQDVFDWRHIIKAYEDLWKRLGEQRRATQHSNAPENWPAVHPAYPNPWRMFESFPSVTLGGGDVMKIVLNKDEIALIMKHEMNFFLPELLVPKDSMQELIEGIRRAGAARVTDILAAFPAPEHDRIERCLGWMLKHGIAVRGTA